MMAAAKVSIGWRRGALTLVWIMTVFQILVSLVIGDRWAERITDPVCWLIAKFGTYVRSAP